ncbi:MAG: hypothetical protein Q8L20_03265 [Gammaproteobacteria bacterium]|nr:hypothetical protein [Gammaproteobacteria bacterium]
MTFGYEDERGAFTQDELDAGIMGILHGPSEYELERRKEAAYLHDQKEKELKEEVRKTRENRAIKAIAGVRLPMQMKRNILGLCQKDEINYAIGRYAKSESLPHYHVELSRDPHCLEVLVKGMLGKVAKIPLTDKLVEEITALCEQVRRNEDIEIPYVRVGRIQRFVHEKTENILGNNARLELPLVHMKNLLSTARLHLSICDIDKRDYNYLHEVRELAKVASQCEEVSPNMNQAIYPTYIYWGGTGVIKNIFPKWRARHMKSIEHYFQKKTRDLMLKIDNVDEHSTSADMQLKLIELYSSLD